MALYAAIALPCLNFSSVSRLMAIFRGFSKSILNASNLMPTFIRLMIYATMDIVKSLLQRWNLGDTGSFLRANLGGDLPKTPRNLINSLILKKLKVSSSAPQ
jgi:hypothetical protein